MHHIYRKDPAVAKKEKIAKTENELKRVRPDDLKLKHDLMG